MDRKRLDVNCMKSENGKNALKTSYKTCQINIVDTPNYIMKISIIRSVYPVAVRIVQRRRSTCGRDLEKT